MNLPNSARPALLALLLLGATGPDVSADIIDLYASDFSSHLRTFNTGTFTATDLGGFAPSYFAGGLDFRADGRLYGISTTLRIIDTTNASNVQVGGTLPVQMASLAFSPSGQLHAVSLSGNRLYQLNPDTSAVIGSFVTITGTGGFDVLGIDYDGNGVLYGVAADSLYRIDPTTGAATLVASGIIPDSNPYTTGTIFIDIDIGADNLLRGFIQPLTTGDVTVATVDPTTGSLLGTSSVLGMTTQSGLASGGPSAVPEPSSMALTGIGLALFLGMFRLVRRNPSAVASENAK